MRTVDRYRGFDIVESDFLAEDGDRLRAALVVPGLKERPDGPVLTSRDEARAWIDAELDAREKASDGEEFRAELKVRGRCSLGVTVPADVARRMMLDVGDEVIVRVRRA